MPTSDIFPRRFLTPLYLAASLNAVNSSVLATALVPIAAALHVSVGQTAALVTALYVASAIAQPTAGKIAEAFGARRVFLVGLVGVIFGALIGGLAESLDGLILSRVLLGIGTSAAYPTAMILIRRRAAAGGMKDVPGGVLGGLQITGLTTAALGLPLGGILIGVFGWRAPFVANLPVAVLALIFALRGIPSDGQVEAPRNLRDLADRIDAAGILLFAAATVALLVFLFALPMLQWLALVVALVLTAILVGWELRAADPFLDVRYLARNPVLSRTYLRWTLTTLCLYTVLYGVTQWLQAVRGLSARDAGLLLLPMMVISVLIVRPISRRNLVFGPLLVAGVSALVGSIAVLFTTSATPLAWVAAITLVFGTTLATTGSGNQLALYTQVDAQRIGTAAGLLRTFGYLGSIASTALISIVFHGNVTDGGLHVIAAVMVVAAALALLITLTDPRLRQPGLRDSRSSRALAAPRARAGPAARP